MELKKKIRKSGVTMHITFRYLIGIVLLAFVTTLIGCSSTGRGDVETPAASTVHAH